LPALFVAQLVLKGGHGEPPAGNLPEKLAVGAPAHRLRVGKIARRDGKLGGLLAPAIAFLSVAIPAVLAVGLLPGCDCVRSRGNRVFQPLGCGRGSPISRGVDRRQSTSRQDYNQG
jgi:hypothetical protein